MKSSHFSSSMTTGLNRKNSTQQGEVGCRKEGKQAQVLCNLTMPVSGTVKKFTAGKSTQIQLKREMIWV